jgi:ribosomal protein L35AE/L33A
VRTQQGVTNMNNVKHIVGYVVVYKFNTKGGGIKGMPVDRHGHFKVYANRQAANRRRYEIGSNYTKVSPIYANIDSTC